MRVSSFSFWILSALPRVAFSLSRLKTPSILTSHNTGISIETIHQFPNNTWVESLAIRPNGQILASLLTSPTIYQLSPIPSSPATLIASFAPYSGCLGIIELSPDSGSEIYYLVVGNATTFNSYAIYKLDLSSYNPNPSFPNCSSSISVSHIASFPDAKILNGLATIDGAKDVILASDSYGGRVFALNITSGNYTSFADPLFAPGAISGVNGLKVRNNTLYFTNTAQGFLGRIEITAEGMPRGNASVVATGLTQVDDFVFDERGAVWFAGDGAVRYLREDGAVVETVKTKESSLLVGSTAVRFGRGRNDRGSLYVSTEGEVAGVPGRIVRLNLGEAGSWGRS